MKDYKQLFDIPFDVKHFYNDVFEPEYKEYLYPGEDGKKEYEKRLAEFNASEANVFFKDIYICFETCDCEYPCSHGRWIYQMKPKNDVQNTIIEFEEDGIFIDNDNGFIRFNNIKSISLGHFYQACQLLDIKLELSEKAHDFFRFKFV